MVSILIGLKPIKGKISKEVYAELLEKLKDNSGGFQNYVEAVE